jgi:hypothetical protein
MGLVNEQNDNFEEAKNIFRRPFKQILNQTLHTIT